MNNHIVHFEIIGKDQKLLESFYGALFSWKMAEGMPGYTLVDPGEGLKGGIGVSATTANHVTFYVHVENVEETLKAAEKHGGRRCFGPHTIPDGAIIGGFFDPEGHMIGVLQAPAGMGS